MSIYSIEIDDKEIVKQIQDILNTIINKEMKCRYSEAGHEISNAVKQIVYSNKDEIIDKVVDKAANEITRKALPKLIEKFSTQEVDDAK